MAKIVLYIHGKGGCAGEAEHYRSIFADSKVLGMDYQAQTPWEAVAEFPALFDSLSRGADEVWLLANSIGAYFAMNALSERNISRAFFISPVVDMENLIGRMMQWAGVSEAELHHQGRIATDFGEDLSWEYLCYVRQHLVRWEVPTVILYGSNDNLTDYAVMESFAERHAAELTVMPGGEHWFHTEEQMRFLDDWLLQASQV